MIMASQQDYMLQELLTCPLCLDEMTKSRLLPCQHGFCISCLQNHADHSAEENKLACPVCHTDSTIPEGGVEHFASNMFIHSLRDALVSVSEDVSHGTDDTLQVRDRQCDSEDCKKSAVYFCTKGCGYLCVECEEYHSKIRITRNHKIVDAEDGGSKDQQLPFCTRHPNHMIELYCDECKIPCCATCVVLTHKNHECCELKIKGKIFREHLEGVLAEVEQCLVVTKAAIISTAQQGQQMEEDVEQLLQQTTDTFTNLRQQMTNEEDSIKQKIIQGRKQAQEELEEVKDKQQMLKASMESAEICGRTMIHMATPYDFVTNTEGFTQHVRQKIIPGPAKYCWISTQITEAIPESQFSAGSVDVTILNPWKITKVSGSRKKMKSSKLKSATKVSGNRNGW